MRLTPVDGRILLVEVEVPVGADPVDWPKDGDDYVVLAQGSFNSLDMALDFVRAHGINTDTFDDAAVARFYKTAADEGVRVANGTWFGDDPRTFRLGFGYLPAPDLKAALEALTTAVRRAC